LAKSHFDPQIIPIDSLAGEEAVRPEQLTVEWLRIRFADPPAWAPELNIEQYRGHRPNGPVPASVLMPIVNRPEGLSLLLTQRTEHLSSHAGQISLPGGRAEASDTSTIDTALRETEEEIGLARERIEVLGLLPDYITGSGYHITPVVGLVQPPFELLPDPSEVAEVFEVPLAFLMDGANHQRRTADLPNGVGRRTFYSMPYQRFFIWGATAGMLRNLFHFLRADDSMPAKPE
jgi:8-oxo-dGTP pyrophosphatase MutT (NUDIX family)